MRAYTQLNMQPTIPNGAIKVDPRLAKLAKGGGSLTIYDRADAVTGFNEGQHSLLGDYERGHAKGEIPKERIMPSLWMIAHAYLESERFRNLFNSSFRMFCTSSARIEKNENEVLIGHSVMPGYSGKGYYSKDKEGIFDVGNYGLVIPLNKQNYPAEEMPLKEFFKQYSAAARALFLMDDSRLEKLLSLMPNFPFDPKRPAVQGTNLVDGNNGEEPLSFGQHCVDKDSFFGVTCAQYVPVSTLSASIGRKNEITKTYSPGEFLALTKAYTKVKRSPTRDHILELGDLLNAGVSIF